MKPQTEEAQIRQKLRLDKQLSKYRGEEPEVVNEALNKELDDYMAGRKKEEEKKE